MQIPNEKRTRNKTKAGKNLYDTRRTTTTTKKKKYTDNGMRWQPAAIQWWYGTQPLAKKASKKRKKIFRSEKCWLIVNV